MTGEPRMSSDVIQLIARLMMAVLFLAGGIPKMLGAPSGREAVSGLGLPTAGLLNRLAGLCLVAGAAMLALGAWIRIAAALLAGALVVVVTPLLLRFWTTWVPLQRAKLIQALGNVGVAGGLLAFAAVGPAFLPAT